MKVTPWHQTNWDARAAANFMCGGSGTGLLFVATLAAQDSFRITALIAMALVALGLTCVWLEIGLHSACHCMAALDYRPVVQVLRPTAFCDVSRTNVGDFSACILRDRAWKRIHWRAWQPD